MRILLTSLAVFAASAGAAVVPDAWSETERAVGSLQLKATLTVISDPAPCPANVPPEGTECRMRTGSGVVPGLGRVAPNYVWVYRVGLPTCPADLAKPLTTTGTLLVAGKGEITFALADGSKCVDLEPVRNEPQDFTITGGTASFAGASGNGSVQRSIGGGVGTETWTGTIDVPGLTFDVTPPKLVGARAKTVRVAKGAKTAKVTFKVAAVDDVDGAVPASCQPRSGSRFKIGKTTVRCEATDSSGNSGKVSFTVTVRPRR